MLNMQVCSDAAHALLLYDAPSAAALLSALMDVHAPLVHRYMHRWCTDARMLIQSMH
jgi:hypothetical protein